MSGQLSSVMLIASDGLIQNQGIAVSGNLTISINNYTAIPVVGEFQSVVSNGVAAVAANNIGNTTLLILETTGSSNFPALTDAISSNVSTSITTLYGNSIANVYGNSVTSFSSLVTSQAQRLIGNTGSTTDLGIFAQAYFAAQGCRITTNQFINSTNNTDVVGVTFTNMDALTTGGMSLVSNNLQRFGQDCAALGDTINLAQVSLLGHPWLLLRQILSQAGLTPALQRALTDAGLTSDDIASVSTTEFGVASTLDKKIYTAFTKVTGNDLIEIRIILRVFTPALNSLADLLDPKKMLPNSYQSLQTQFPSGQAPNYSGIVNYAIYAANGQVAPQVFAYYQNQPEFAVLSTIIPPDQAAANLAWARSLGQVKNITQITLAQLSAAALAIETNTGLAQINSLTSPVPSSVTTGLDSQLATGSGPNGTLTMFDFMGALAGTPFVTEFNLISSNINAIPSTAFSNLTNATSGIYGYMNRTFAGVYDDLMTPPQIVIPDGPAAGTYGNMDLAFTTGLIPAANTIITSIAGAYPSATANTNASYTIMANALVTENQNLALAQVDFANLQSNSRSSVLAFASELHEIGQDIALGGPAEFVAAVADQSTLTGQAIVASLREGRNIAALNDLGIGIDTQLPNT